MAAKREYTEDELALIRKTLKDLFIGLCALAIPYVLIGVVWAETHNDHLAYEDGIDKAFSYIGEIIAWPALIVADVTLK